MNRLFSSPMRNLAGGVSYMLLVSAIATLCYCGQGWPLGDAVYMVAMTVFTVGYGEVHAIDTPALRAITIGLMVFGCTGMIFVTGALVQMINASQFQALMGTRRMRKTIDELTGHVIICGFGRIGQTLARELAAAGTPFVVLERDETRLGTGLALDYLCLGGDATDETALTNAGIMRARALATVLPDDAANVFITLSARAMNHDLVIIARGEAPSTETKLLRAGANRVVLPAHIGAERMAELLLFSDASTILEGRAANGGMQRSLKHMGLELEIVPIAAGSPADGTSVGEVEAQGQGSFLIVALHRKAGGSALQPPRDTVLTAGDAVALLGRPGRAGLVEKLFQTKGG